MKTTKRNTLTPERIKEWKARAAEKRIRNLQKRWAFLKTGTYWACAMNRFHESRRVAHVVFRGGAMCGINPHSMGGSFLTAAEAGGRECVNCRRMLEEVKHYVGTP